MKRIAFFITTRIGVQLQYVRTETVAANGELIVDLTTEVTQAKEYDTPDQADWAVPRIRNPFDRVYKTTPTAVWHPKKNSYSETIERVR